MRLTRQEKRLRLRQLAGLTVVTTQTAERLIPDCEEPSGSKDHGDQAMIFLVTENFLAEELQFAPTSAMVK